MLTPLHRYPEVKSQQCSSPWTPLRGASCNSAATVFDAFPHFLDSGGLVAIVTVTFAQDFPVSPVSLLHESLPIFEAIRAEINTKTYTNVNCKLSFSI